MTTAPQLRYDCITSMTQIRWDHNATMARLRYDSTTTARLRYDCTNSVRLQSVHGMTSVRLNAKARLPKMHDCDTTALRVWLSGTIAIRQHKFGTITMRQWQDCGRTALPLWHAYDRIVNRLVYDWNTTMARLGTTTARLKNDFRTIAWDFDMTTKRLGYDCNTT